MVSLAQGDLCAGPSNPAVSVAWELARPSSPGEAQFETGPLAGKRVNVKAYGRHDGLLNVSPYPCDYYLVLAGPQRSARHRPWTIKQVFLFDAQTLLMALKERGVKIGIATSVRKNQRQAARIHGGNRVSAKSRDDRFIQLAGTGSVPRSRCGRSSGLHSAPRRSVEQPSREREALT